MQGNIKELKEFIDCFNRFQMESLAISPALVKEDFSQYVRFTGPSSSFYDNTIYCPHLDLCYSETEAFVEKQIEYFSAKAKDFEFKIYDFNKLTSLEEILVLKGFKVSREDRLMYSSTDIKLTYKSSAEISKALSSRDYQEMEVLSRDVWGTTTSGFFSDLEKEARLPSGRLEVFHAKMHDKQVSCGWVRHYSELSEFFGGSTLKEYRRQGIYHDLVKARIEAAKTHSSKYVVSECSPDSEIALKKIGFNIAGTMRGYCFKKEQPHSYPGDLPTE